MRSSWLVLMGALCACSGSHSNTGNPGNDGGGGISREDWTPHALTNVRALLRFKGKWIAAGFEGQIASSTDGKTWTHHDVGSGVVRALGASPDLVLAIADAGVVRSSDGEAWTHAGELANALGGNLNGLAWGNGRWVAAGDGFIATSTDASSWTTTQLQSPLHDVTFAGGHFFMAGDQGVFSTDDGRTLTNVFPGGPFYGIGAGQSVIEVVGLERGAVSTDSGATWSSSAVPKNVSMLDVAYLGGRFVTVGNTLGDLPYMLTTSESAPYSWQVVPVTFKSRLFSVAGGDGLFLAGGDGGSVLSSSDGMSWTPLFMGATSGYGTAATDGTHFVVGGTSEGVLAYSDDGVTWETTETVGGIGGLAFGGGQWVALTFTGEEYTSTDGRTWTDAGPNLPGSPIVGLAYGNGTFVAIIQKGGIFSPPGPGDTTSWVQMHAAGGGDLRAIAYGDGRFVAVGEQALTSTDGKQWTSLASEPVIGDAVRFGLSCITWGAGQWVASFGASDFVNTPPYTFISSSDGLSWEGHSVPGLMALRGLAVQGDTFYGISGNPSDMSLVVDGNLSSGLVNGTFTPPFTDPVAFHPLESATFLAITATPTSVVAAGDLPYTRP